MSRGGRRWGIPHVSVENSHSLSAWGRFQWEQREYERGNVDDLRVKWQEENGFLVLVYKRDGGKYTERIRLTETPCHFGGSRYWFVCLGCGRRVGKVYLPTNLYYNGERVQRWLCRHCYSLTYEQRRDRNPTWVLKWRADRLLSRSGIKITKRGYYRRPKGMKWKTFERLTDKLNAIYKRKNGQTFGQMWSFLVKKYR